MYDIISLTFKYPLMAVLYSKLMGRYSQSLSPHTKTIDIAFLPAEIKCIKNIVFENIDQNIADFRSCGALLKNLFEKQH